VKRRDLIKTIEEFGCVFVRHGGKHDWYRNPVAGNSNRYRDIGKSRKVWPVTSSKC
jgi:mRNA interferase HicA